MGETRVDLQHLLEDIRDAYPGSLEETIVTEMWGEESGKIIVRARTKERGEPVINGAATVTTAPRSRTAPGETSPAL